MCHYLLSSSPVQSTITNWNMEEDNLQSAWYFCFLLFIDRIMYHSYWVYVSFIEFWLSKVIIIYVVFHCRVVYFSIHRYEHGEFWPNLRESDFDYVGEGPGAGFNFNVPLNTTGLGDADYMAVFHQVLLPMATEVSLALCFYNEIKWLPRLSFG